MADQAVNAHNAARAAAPGGSRPSLTWSENLASHAQAWANQLAQSGSLEHDPNAGEGENLYGTTGEPSLQNAVNARVDEAVNYQGEKIGEIDLGAVGHYTQVVWPETTEVGMAMAKGSNGWTYVVGRYSPPGNFTGQSAWRAGPSGPSTPAPSNPRPSKQGGFYLVNGYKLGRNRSGIAWYNSLGGNDGKQPDKFVVIKDDGVVTWEGATHYGKFPDGVAVKATVKSDDVVKAAGNFTEVGNATVGGTQHGVYKDNIRVLYQNDGWDVYCVYYG